VNLRRLTVFSEGDTVDPVVLAARGLIRAGHKVKVLGDGELTTRLTVRAHAFSKSARAKIGAVGGAAELIGQADKLNA